MVKGSKLFYVHQVPQKLPKKHHYSQQHKNVAKYLGCFCNELFSNKFQKSPIWSHWASYPLCNYYLPFLSLSPLSLSLSLCGSLSSPKVRCHSSSLREILKNFLNKSRGRTLKVYKRRLSTEEQLKRRPQAEQPTTSRSCNIASTNVNDNVVIVIIIIIWLRTARH